MLFIFRKEDTRLNLVYLYPALLYKGFDKGNNNNNKTSKIKVKV